jgi:hypothetical protein
MRSCGIFSRRWRRGCEDEDPTDAGRRGECSGAGVPPVSGRLTLDGVLPPSNFYVSMILRSIDTGETPEETGETPAPLPDRGLRMENFGAGRNGG